MLVGPRDVGKTALLHEVAGRLAKGDVPPALRGRPLWRITANELIAGATYTGMWQDRARMVVARGRSGGAIFAMGDPAGIVDAGRWAKSDNNVARFLRPYVESGELSLICECTPEVLAAAHRSEPSFVDAFHRVDVPEPSVEDAGHILHDAARRLEQGQGVGIDGDALAAALELTQRFEPYRALPGKAVRLLDEVVQRVVAGDGELRIGREEVTAAFAERTGLPLLMLSDKVSLRVGRRARVLRGARPRPGGGCRRRRRPGHAGEGRPAGAEQAARLVLLRRADRRREDRADEGARGVPVRQPRTRAPLRHGRVRLGRRGAEADRHGLAERRRGRVDAPGPGAAVLRRAAGRDREGAPGRSSTRCSPHSARAA